MAHLTIRPVGPDDKADWRRLWTAYLAFYETSVPEQVYETSLRGQGIGRALIEAVYDAADKAGAPSVYWLTQEFNYIGRMLYDRIGTKTPFIRYNRT